MAAAISSAEAIRDNGTAADSSASLSGPRAAVISVSTIHGGVRNNIIPDDVVMEGTLRSHDEGVRALVKQLFQRAD